jgi:hypothetical protein
MDKNAIHPHTYSGIHTVMNSAGFGSERIGKDTCGDADQGHGDAGLGELTTMRFSLRETAKPGKKKARLRVKIIDGLDL